MGVFDVRHMFFCIFAILSVPYRYLLSGMATFCLKLLVTPVVPKVVRILHGQLYTSKQVTYFSKACVGPSNSTSSIISNCSNSSNSSSSRLSPISSSSSSRDSRRGLPAVQGRP